MGKSVVNNYQPSITEWFSKIGETQESKMFSQEDNTRDDRLAILNQTIKLPIDWFLKFSATDLINLSPEFKEALLKKGKEACAIRLVPKENHQLPKLRDRGQILEKSYKNWFLKQKISHKDYDAFICPHTDLLWSIIFVVNKNLIFGEIVKGMHFQLTQGTTYSKTYTFQFDFEKWSWSEKDNDIVREVKRYIKAVKLDNEKLQNKLKKSLNANFSHNFLIGYFEGFTRPDNKTYFSDYNRILPNHIPTPPLMVKTLEESEIRGTIASSGLASGKIVKVSPANIGKVDFPTNSILLTENADVRFLPLMKKANAIITIKGGMLSHASIIARELRKPCLVSCSRAVKLRNGTLVEVDANIGRVNILTKI